MAMPCRIFISPTPTSSVARSSRTWQMPSALHEAAGVHFRVEVHVRVAVGGVCVNLCVARRMLFLIELPVMSGQLRPLYVEKDLQHLPVGKEVE